MTKKIILSTTLFFSFLISNAQIDLKFNVLGAINKKFEFSAEYALSENKGIELIAGYSAKAYAAGVSINGEDVSTPRNGFILGIKPNFYTNTDAGLDGFYIAPYANYSNLTIKFDDKVKQTKLATGVILGYKMLFTDRIGAQFEAGLGYNVVDKSKYVADGTEAILTEKALFGNLSKINIPIKLSLVYRLGGY